MREVLFGVVLLCAAALITAGVAMFSPAAALIVAGVLLAPGAWLVLGDA